MKKDDIIIMRPIRCDINGQPEENSVKITWVMMPKKYSEKYWETHGNWDDRYANTGIGTGTPKGNDPATWDSSCPLCSGQQHVTKDGGHTGTAEVECENCGAVQEIIGDQTILHERRRHEAI